MSYAQSAGKWIKACDYMPPINNKGLYVLEFTCHGVLDDRFWCNCGAGCLVNVSWNTVDFAHPSYDLRCYPVLCNGSLRVEILCEGHHDIHEQITKENIHYYIPRIDMVKASLSEHLVAWLKVSDLQRE